MVSYRYEFADLRTDRNLAVLDLSGVTFDRRVCQPGSFRATVAVPNATVAAQVQRLVPRDDSTIGTGPGRSVVHVYRDESIWGSYIIWSATVQSDKLGRVTVDLQGAGLESYLDHREIRADITFTQVDQLDIARSLITDMQAQGADATLGIETGGQATSGILRDRTYKASEAATYGQRLVELSQVIDGPEWMIRTWVDPATGARRRAFIVADRLGTVSDGEPAPARWTFMQPGDVTNWSYPADATDVATSWRTRGDTIDDDPTVTADVAEQLLSGIWESAAYPAAGWPLLEKTIDYQGVVRVATLDEYAQWWAVNRAGMVRIPQVGVRLPADTDFHPNALGDLARLKLKNTWFTTGFDRSWRVIGCEITPPTRDDGIERMTLIFEEPKDTAASERQEGAPPPPPPAPVALRAPERGDTSVTLEWDPVETADLYHVYQDGDLIAAPTATTYQVQGLPYGRFFEFTVTALNLGGESPPTLPLEFGTAIHS